ncbi:MAG: gluconolaconase [Cyclobacteriaceae bacterium]
MKLQAYFTLLIIGCWLIACKSENKKEEQTEKVAPEETVKQRSLTKLWETDTLLTTCESVFYDASNQILYSANMGNVPPNAKDGDGFLSKVSLTGEIIELRWIEGLDAPKGMGKVGNKLYVANIDELVEVDLDAGEISNRFPVEGSQFLNDITTASDGTVFISDTRTNKIHTFKNGTISTWLEKEDMGGPNGLLHQGGKLMLATFGDGNFQQIDTQTKGSTLLNNATPGGDGVVAVGDDYLVSNWNGEVFFVDAKGNNQKLLDTKAEKLNAADIAFIDGESTLLVPTFFGNKVMAYKLN